jgi:hypothetical protein
VTEICGKFCTNTRQSEQDCVSFCAENNPENNVRGTNVLSIVLGLQVQ